MNADGEEEKKPLKMFNKRDLSGIPRSSIVIGSHRNSKKESENVILVQPQQQPQQPTEQAAHENVALGSPSLAERPGSGAAHCAIEAADIWVYLKENPAKVHEIPPGSTPNESQKIKIVNEIISTENDYVRDLAFVSVYYIMPLKTDPQGLKPNERDILFKNWDPMLLINFEILAKLEKAPIEEISDVFMSHAVYLKCYNSFCSSQSTRSRLVKEVTEKNDGLRLFFESVRALPDSRKLDLESFLMKPIQRICKYPLLLRELLKCSTDPVESRKIEDAMDKIQLIADGVNRSTQTADNQTHIREIDKALIFKNKKGEQRPVLVLPSRVFINEGPAFDIQRKEEVHLILFNDLLIITQTSRKQTYKVLDWIDLGTYMSEVKLECIAECLYLPMVSIFTDNSRFSFRDTSEIGWASLIPQFVPIREAIAGKPWFCEESQVQTRGRELEPGDFFITYSAAHVTGYDIFININKTIKRMAVLREDGVFICKVNSLVNQLTKMQNPSEGQP